MVLLSALALLAPVSEPIQLVSSPTGGVYSVIAEVGGKMGQFLIGTTQNYSYVVPGFLKEGAADYLKANVKLGGADLGETYVGIDRSGYLKEGGFQGVLGTDVLDNCAFGLDYASGEVFFWPEGRLERKDAEAWMKSDVKVDRIRGWIENGALSINLKFGGQEFLIGIAPDIPWTVLGTKAAAAAKGVKLYSTYARHSSTGERIDGVEGRMTTTFSRGELPSTYLEFVSLPAVKATEDAGFGEGVLNPRDLNANRLIFDLPGRCIWLPQTPTKVEAYRSLSRIFDIPLVFGETDIKIGDRWSGSHSLGAYHAWKDWTGATVRRLADYDPASLVKTLSTPGKPAETLVANLYPQLRKGISVEVERGGKEGAVRTPALKAPGE